MGSQWGYLFATLCLETLLANKATRKPRTHAGGEGTQTQTHVRSHTRAHIQAHTNTHTYTQTHTHTHTCTHTLTYPI